MTTACISAWALRNRSTRFRFSWPSGREQTLEKQAVDRVITVEEPK